MRSANVRCACMVHGISGSLERGATGRTGVGVDTRGDGEELFGEEASVTRDACEDPIIPALSAVPAGVAGNGRPSRARYAIASRLESALPIRQYTPAQDPPNAMLLRFPSAPLARRTRVPPPRFGEPGAPYLFASARPDPSIAPTPVPWGHPSAFRCPAPAHTKRPEPRVRRRQQT
jgi:hypothetical protein